MADRPVEFHAPRAWCGLAVLLAACMGPAEVQDTGEGLPSPRTALRETHPCTQLPDCEDDFSSCQADADCVEAPADPCGCAMGGESTAVAASCERAWESLVGVGTAWCEATIQCGDEIPRCEGCRCTYR